jgi:fatty acid kinase
MNPSTADILGAAEAAVAPGVVVLPNNPNVILSAEQAAEHAVKPIRVVPTRSIQAGIAAMIAFDGSCTVAENAAGMAAAAAAVVTGAVTIASRDVDLGGREVRSGAYLGLVEGEPATGGEDFEETAEAVLERLLAEPRGVLTILTGEGAPDVDGLLDRLSERHPEIEIDVHEGGQPHYHLLLSAE